MLIYMPIICRRLRDYIDTHALATPLKNLASNSAAGIKTNTPATVSAYLPQIGKLP